MGLFDQIIEETVALLKSDSALSSCRILKAHPDQFHQSPLSKVTVTVSFAGAEIANAAMGDFWEPGPPGILWQVGGYYAEFNSMVAAANGREAAWTAASNLCGALMFSGLGFMNIQCGEISYDSSAMAFLCPAGQKRSWCSARLPQGKRSPAWWSREISLKEGSEINAPCSRETRGLLGLHGFRRVMGFPKPETGRNCRPFAIRGNRTGCIPFKESAMEKPIFGEDSEMAAMIEAALVNGASGVKAVKAGTEDHFDYEAAFAALAKEGEYRRCVLRQHPGRGFETAEGQRGRRFGKRQGTDGGRVFFR